MDGPFSFSSLVFTCSYFMASERRCHSLASFQDDWLADDVYKTWVRKVDGQPHKAYCILCRKTIDLSNGGSSALASHHAGKKHQGVWKERAENRIGKLFNSTPLGTSSTAAVDGRPINSTLTPFVLSDDVLDAEIIWCLHLVQSHQSYRSCNSLPEIFRPMFKTCPIAQQFQMKKDKVKYLIVYGLYPALKANLRERINQSPCFSVSFDESLNHHQQKCQMDVNVRYWNESKHIAESAYYDSKFVLRPNALNLKEELLKAIEDLSIRKFIHLGMDGPSTNWNVLDLIDEHLVSHGFVKTLNIGSCSLHVLHGAFQTGILASDWEIEKVLKSLFKIFDDSPARRDVYLNEGTSEVFPLKFCAIRWIEDEPVAHRGLEVWSSVVSAVKFWLKLTKSKQPKNKSFETLLKYYQDPFIPAKLHFFAFTAGILKPYLVIFQTDSPLIPFLFDELSKILNRLVGLVYKKEVAEVVNLRSVMNKEFLLNTNNQLEEFLVDLGSATTDSVKKLNVASEKKRKFRCECKEIVIGVLLKLLERLPTNKMLIVNASALSPVNMARYPTKSQKRFKRLADNLFSLNAITSQVADNAKFQFDQFMSKEVVLHHEKFLSFDFKSERLDSFFPSTCWGEP